MPTLWAMKASYQSVNPGDYLPIVIKTETVESIKRFNKKDGANAPEDFGRDLDEDSADEPTLHESVLLAYVKELLATAFPSESINDPASRLDLELIALVLPEDTISLSGKVVSKREEAAGGLVEYEIVIENHRQETIGRAVGAVVMAL